MQQSSETPEGEVSIQRLGPGTMIKGLPGEVWKSAVIAETDTAETEVVEMKPGHVLTFSGNGEPVFTPFNQLGTLRP